jgi:hypothetical protein
VARSRSSSLHAPATRQGLGGQLADQAGGQPLAGDGLLAGHCGGQGPVGQALDLAGRQPTGGLQVLDEPVAASGADLGWGDIAADEPQPALGGQIQHSFQARMDANQQVMQADQPAGLVDLAGRRGGPPAAAAPAPAR